MSKKSVPWDTRKRKSNNMKGVQLHNVLGHEKISVLVYSNYTIFSTKFATYLHMLYNGIIGGDLHFFQ